MQIQILNVPNGANTSFYFIISSKMLPNKLLAHSARLGMEVAADV